MVRATPKVVTRGSIGKRRIGISAKDLDRVVHRAIKKKVERERNNKRDEKGKVRESNEEVNECSSCGEEIENWVCCGECEEWLHMECEGMTREQIKKEYGKEEDYVCAKCVEKKKKDEHVVNDNEIDNNEEKDSGEKDSEEKRNKDCSGNDTNDEMLKSDDAGKSEQDYKFEKSDGESEYTKELKEVIRAGKERIEKLLDEKVKVTNAKKQMEGEVRRLKNELECKEKEIEQLKKTVNTLTVKKRDKEQGKEAEMTVINLTGERRLITAVKEAIGWKEKITESLDENQEIEEVIMKLKKLMEDKKKNEKQLQKNKTELKHYQEIATTNLKEKEEAEKERRSREKEIAEIKEINRRLEMEVVNKKDQRNESRNQQNTGNRRQETDDRDWWYEGTENGGWSPIDGKERVCLYYAKKGRCKYGKECRFVHAKICWEIVNNGFCKRSNCKFSHDKTVICQRDEKGECNSSQCKFMHKLRREGTRGWTYAQDVIDTNRREYRSGYNNVRRGGKRNENDRVRWWDQQYRQRGETERRSSNETTGNETMTDCNEGNDEQTQSPHEVDQNYMVNAIREIQREMSQMKKEMNRSISQMGNENFWIHQQHHIQPHSRWV